MTVGSVPSSGLAHVQARISAIQSQIAALNPATPSVSLAANFSTGTEGGAPSGASGNGFAAALDSALERQTATGVGALATPPGAIGAPWATARTVSGIPSVVSSAPAVSSVAGATAPPSAPLVRPPSGGAAGGWTSPVDGRVSSTFGHRHNVAGRAREFHTGLDIAAPQGTPVRAASAGVVRSAGRDGNYGNSIVIDHGNGVTTRYAHNSALHVRPGQQVGTGETIAAVGSTGRSTGPHLHFEVRVNGDAVDPTKWLRTH